MTPKITKAKQRQKRQQPQERKPQQKPAHPPKSLLAKIFSWTWKVFAGLAVILGVCVSSYPRLSVTPSTYLDPSNPLKALFNVTNDGFFPVQNVQTSCAIRRVVTMKDLKIVGEPDFSSRLLNPAHFSKELAAGESDTIFCGLGVFDLHSPVESADIAIVVAYSAFGVHWPNKVFPFTTQRDINGQLHWIKHPLKK